MARIIEKEVTPIFMTEEEFLNHISLGYLAFKGRTQQGITEDIVFDIIKEKNPDIDIKLVKALFNKLMKDHQEISKKSAKNKFK